MRRMNRIYDFISSNLTTIGLIYLIGAGIVFVGVLLFFWWICKAEDKERELYPDDAFYYPEETAGTATTMIIALFVAIGCAILWWGVPLLFLGVWIFDKMTRKFPALMGDMADDAEEFDKEESEE